MSQAVPLVSRRGFLPVALAVLLGCGLGCGGDLTLPDASGNGIDLSIVDGRTQTGVVGEPLPRLVVVKVATQAGQPIGGRRVAFVLSDPSAGTIDPDTAITSSEGQASARWVLGTRPGEYQGEARLVTTDSTAPPSIPFAATAHAGPPDTVRAVSPQNQFGRREHQLDDPLVVAVVDRFGNPVPGAAVHWSVTSGGGSLSAEETATGSDGTTSVAWTLGPGIGLQRASAAVEGATGSPLTFTATVLF
ncbi:MAG TPA: Ig-like domain-containing protein [Gemmatimonadales bacterium]|jgi:hypothetical protein|nr:Ig-like domain-containing protein [Gemmatimonadales bacterium]